MPWQYLLLIPTTEKFDIKFLCRKILKILKVRSPERRKFQLDIQDNRFKLNLAD